MSIEARKGSIRKLIGKQVRVEALGQNHPGEATDIYIPLPEYRVSLWLDKEEQPEYICECGGTVFRITGYHGGDPVHRCEHCNELRPAFKNAKTGRMSCKTPNVSALPKCVKDHFQQQGGVVKFDWGYFEKQLIDEFNKALTIDDVMFKVMLECAENRKRWGDDHDDEHTVEEWIGILAEYLSRLAHDTPQDYRHDLTKIAAVAIAAARAFERKQTWTCI